ncbi:MAG: hypothetical protein ACR2J8_02070 [Thermomicrobiales bacterium]
MVDDRDPGQLDPAEPPDDRAIPPGDELAQGVRWLMSDLLRCLLAAGLIALGFLLIASIGGWPWSGVAVGFVVVAAAVAVILLRSGLWVMVVTGVFVLISVAPRWLAPDVRLADGPMPLTFEQQSGWITGAMAAGLAAWFAGVMLERALAALRRYRAWRREREG